MSVSNVFNDIAEMAHLDEYKFLNECEQVLLSPRPNAALKSYAAKIQMAPFMEPKIGEATRQEFNDLMGRPEPNRLMREIRLVRLSNQKIYKQVRVCFWLGRFNKCYGITFHFPIQFLGYGSYSLCHYQNGGLNDRNLNNFFNNLAQNHVNFHRTMIFSAGNYEDKKQPVVNLLKKVTVNGQPKIVTNDAFFTNLAQMASIARRYGVILQVCLFYHHSITGSNGINPPPPLSPSSFGNSPALQYKNFYSENGPWTELQTEIIQKVTSALMNHWNVVYEVGNELRVDNPLDCYGNPQLNDWIDWAARMLECKSYGKLVTTSSGKANEAMVCKLNTISFLSYHGGQWFKPNFVQGIQEARERAKNLYNDKHVVIDDDGQTAGRNDPSTVKSWAVAALSSGGEGACSFNHKGPFSPITGFGAGINQLTALRDAWNAVFQRYAPGSPVFVQKPKLVIQP